MRRVLELDLRIRDAIEADIGVIIKLRRQLDNYHSVLRPQQFISADLYNEQTVKSYFEAEKSRVVVCVLPQTDDLIAYAVLNTERTVERTIYRQRSMIYVNDLCVSEDFRGKGIGRFLFQFIIDYAKEMNVDAVELDVYASNKEAVGLYESMDMKDKTRRLELNL
jgi:ribosomal protein S18 acetylase RimI-like enzyme